MLFDIFGRSSSSQNENVHFTPIPGSFPTEEQEENNQSDSGSSGGLRKILKFMLYTPLLLLYYSLNTILTLVEVFKPLGKLFHFYDKRDRSFNEDLNTQFVNLLESLSQCNDTKEAGGYTFTQLYNIEDGILKENMIKGGYSDVLKVCSRDGKFALLFLHDPMLYDSMEYLREILISAQFVEMVKKYNCILWFCDVTTPQGYQTANSLKVRQFPFLGALGSHTENKMILVARIEGVLFDYDFNQFEAKLSIYYPKLLEIRRQRQYQELQRLVREQQDSRYQASLRRDEQRDADQRRAVEEAALKQQWLHWRRSVLRPEPQSGGCRVNIRIADGRIIRRFDSSSTIEEIYAFVALEKAGLLNEQHEILQAVARPNYEYRYDFQLYSPVPRKLLDPSVTISEEDAIFPSGTIIVESIE